MKALDGLLSCLLDVFWPERCWLCGDGTGEKSWVPPGPLVAGLRRWDRTHLCRSCLRDLAGPVQTATYVVADGPPLSATAGMATCDRLVDLVGGFKYQRVRGLAWPLAAIARPALESIVAGRTSGIVLVPVPLHPNRRRDRGFNQAETLANLLGRSGGLPVRADLVHRCRETAQQAQIDTDIDRAGNMQAAFRARPAGAAGSGELVLVDDLITSGATMAACALALREAGHRVSRLLAAGLARGADVSTRTDTAKCRTSG